MLRLIAVQMVSIIPLVRFHPAEALALSGVNNPGPSLTSASPSHKSGLDNHSDSFCTCWALGFEWVPGFGSVRLCHRPSRQLRALIFQRVQRRSPRSAAARLPDFLIIWLSHSITRFPTFFLPWPEVTWRKLRTPTCFSTLQMFELNRSCFCSASLIILSFWWGFHPRYLLLPPGGIPTQRCPLLKPPVKLHVWLRAFTCCHKNTKCSK